MSVLPPPLKVLTGCPWNLRRDLSHLDGEAPMPWTWLTFLCILLGLPGVRAVGSAHPKAAPKSLILSNSHALVPSASHDPSSAFTDPSQSSSSRGSSFTASTKTRERRGGGPECARSTLQPALRVLTTARCDCVLYRLQVLRGVFLVRHGRC